MVIPFKLVIKLATPLVMGRTRTTLDGLLSAAVYRETGLMGKDTIPHIPLEQGEDGIFKASCMFVAGAYSHETVGRIMSIRGRNDLDASLFSPNSKGKLKRYLGVDTARGPYKSNMSSYQGIDAKTVVFFGVGDPDRVVQMIENNILGLGKRSNAGAGQIMGIHWEPVIEDESWVTAAGKPARPLPLAIWKKLSASRSVPIAHVTVRIPYWETAMAVEAVHPVGLTI